jgi:hypothetical protein
MKGRCEVSSRRRSLILTATVIIALLAAALLAASCGGSSTSSNGTTPTGSKVMTGKAEIDSFLNQLDQQMSSMPSDGDLNDSTLNNSQLGI